MSQVEVNRRPPHQAYLIALAKCLTSYCRVSTGDLEDLAMKHVSVIEIVAFCRVLLKTEFLPDELSTIKNELHVLVSELLERYSGDPAKINDDRTKLIYHAFMEVIEDCDAEDRNP